MKKWKIEKGANVDGVTVENLLLFAAWGFLAVVMILLLTGCATTRIVDLTNPQRPVVQESWVPMWSVQDLSQNQVEETPIGTGGGSVK